MTALLAIAAGCDSEDAHQSTRPAQAREATPQAGSRVAQSDEGESSHNSGYDDPDQVVLRVPADRVLSGLPAEGVRLQLRAFALLPDEKVQEKLVDAVEVLDGQGNSVPVSIEARLDENGNTDVAVRPVGRLKEDQWYKLVAYALPPDVALEGGASEWAIDFYTGDLVQVARVMQGEPPKDGVVYLRMTQEVDFLPPWSSRILLDERSAPIPGCMQLNGECSNKAASPVRVRDVAIVVEDHDARSRLSSIAVLDNVRGPLQGKSMRLAFQPCMSAGARCAGLPARSDQ